MTYWAITTDRDVILSLAKPGVVVDVQCWHRPIANNGSCLKFVYFARETDHDRGWQYEEYVVGTYKPDPIFVDEGDWLFDTSKTVYAALLERKHPMCRNRQTGHAWNLLLASRVASR